ncbi:LemA family protein [Treponema phagedenis]|uniref:LemA family protein n=1 Tax=Treponema phagedenis TaxID=162 RepID=A0A0B7H0X4_TREPH|nr:LemA family protein [Treponema phagedenis]EFW37842.1 LemA family protein [Treponema phagedenis F0421]NVP23316.1 LemA family protein [Treponema phagedenis]QEJ94903.1 LemA family protein [Treponema phagedenis]QEJ97887.1 LemA family protein [Treponema phagedenis]QEK00803.1 LemA family protein [Treponema phagedenis]
MTKGLKTTLIVVGVIVVIGFMLYNFFVGNYNSMVTQEEGVKSAWSQVENVYQRRLDLIPNLVSTVKGYAKHEQDTFTKLAEARSQAGGVIKIDEDMLDDPEKFAKFQKAQNQLGSSLQRLLAVAENYPELKANQNFLDLQSQLEGTENRIAVERKRYNEVVQQYNGFIRVFPKSFIANMFGFRPKAYFQADEEASKAPKVEF